MDLVTLSAVTGVGQLILAFLVFLGFDAKALGRYFSVMTTWTRREKITVILMVGGLLFSAYALYGASIRQRADATVTPSETLTPKDLGRRVRAGLESSGFAVRSEDVKGRDFTFILVNDLGNSVASIYKRPESRMVEMSALVTVGPEHRKVFQGLSEIQRKRYVGFLNRELLQYRISYKATPVKLDSTIETIQLWHFVSIQQAIDEFQLVQQVSVISAAQKLVIFLVKELETITPESTRGTTSPRP
jgi:hypothetical protein